MKGTLSSARARSQPYSIGGAGELAFPPRVSPCMHCTYSFRDSPPNSTPYFRRCLRSVTSSAAVHFKLAYPHCPSHPFDPRILLCYHPPPAKSPYTVLQPL